MGEALPLVPKSSGLQYQHLPFALTVAVVLVGVLQPKHVPEWPFAPWAFFYGWLYIRYLMWFSYAEAYGDHAPDFCFAALFPPRFRPLVAWVGSVTHRVASFACSLELRENDVESGQGILYDPAVAMETEMTEQLGDGHNNSKSIQNERNVTSTAPLSPKHQLSLSPKRRQHERNGVPPMTEQPEKVLSDNLTSQERYELRRAKALALLEDNLTSLLSGGALKNAEFESKLSFEEAASKGLALLELMEKQCEAG